MSHLTHIQMATIRVTDYKSLLREWRFRGGPRSIVGLWIVDRLTRSQLRRLPKALKRRLQVRDDLAFLERLYNLPDPRGL
jgi:hypothetical protein